MAQPTAFEQWAAAYGRMASEGTELLYPSETLIRLFKGNYIPGLDRANLAGKRVLDVGFGNGNNLLFLGTLGLSLHGTEVAEFMVEAVNAKLARFGLTGDLKVGFNRSLPFPDASFDFLVSWNVLHHEDSREAVIAALTEYRRVLAPSGRLLLCTPGPGHKILRGSEKIAPHQYRIGRSDDFRRGETYWYVEDEETIRELFPPVFADVLTGRTRDDLFSDSLDYFLVTGVLPE